MFSNNCFALTSSYPIVIEETEMLDGDEMCFYVHFTCCFLLFAGMFVSAFVGFWHKYKPKYRAPGWTEGGENRP